MPSINRTQLLQTLIKHETLTIDDLAKEENVGFVPDKAQLNYLLEELTESGHLSALADVNPATYTITNKGISEGERLSLELA